MVSWKIFIPLLLLAVLTSQQIFRPPIEEANRIKISMCYMIQILIQVGTRRKESPNLPLVSLKNSLKVLVEHVRVNPGKNAN